jgi:hypothetical protein
MVLEASFLTTDHADTSRIFHYQFFLVSTNPSKSQWNPMLNEVAEVTWAVLAPRNLSELVEDTRSYTSAL